MSKEYDKFPVLWHYKVTEKDRNPKFVKWAELIEAQAQTNHGQSLTRLAERGGLSPREIVANVQEKRYWDIEHMSDSSVRVIVEQLAI